MPEVIKFSTKMNTKNNLGIVISHLIKEKDKAGK